MTTDVVTELEAEEILSELCDIGPYEVDEMIRRWMDAKLLYDQEFSLPNYAKKELGWGFVSQLNSLFDSLHSLNGLPLILEKNAFVVPGVGILWILSI